MFHKKLSLRILAAVFAAFLVLPTAAQGVFAATDPQITVIVEMKSEPLFAQDAVLQLNSEAQQNYSEKTGTERDKVLARAEKSVGSLEVKYTYADVFNGAAVTIRESELKELKKVSGVAKVYEPAKVKLITDDIDDETLEAFNQRASEMIGLASAREQGYEGEGTLVAIIDGGFETKHENFQPLDSTDNKLSRADVIDTIKSGALSSSTIRSSAYVSSKIPYFHSYAIDSSKGEPLLNAEPDHGTHVAGIAAGNGPAMQGVAPKAQLAMLQVSFESDEAYISDVVAAINDAVTLGADAMNISLGENWKDAKFEAYEPMTKAVENARNAGVLVACAAGNEGSLLTETDNPYYATDCFPSTAPGATSIGAGNSDSVSTLSNATISFKGETLEYLTVADGYAHNGSFEIAAPLKLGAMAARVTVSLKKNGLAGKFVPITKSMIGFEQDELMHQNIGDDGIDAVDVLVIVQAYASFVPVFLEHLVQLGLGSLDEDIPPQCAADLVVGLFVLRHRTGLPADEVAVEIRAFLFRLGEPVQEQVRDEVAQGRAVALRVLGLLVDQVGLQFLGFQVRHDVPVVCYVLMSLHSVHIFPLSRPRCSWQDKCLFYRWLRLSARYLPSELEHPEGGSF